MSERFTVGLTGGIGSGKTTIANMFADFGASIIDTDVIAHQLTQPDGIAIPVIREQFGDAYLTDDGAMDRARMRELVFADSGEKQKLENILHPLIRQETEKAASLATGLYLIFVVPLLIESTTWRNKVSRILVVDCEEQTQIHRVMTRNNLSAEQVRAIMRAQASRQQRQATADDLIFNDGDLSSVKAEVRALHEHYASLAKLSINNHHKIASSDNSR
ncbi:dephospho-CoA kinase [Undibacterium aquatile]|uniref:Dephospho-CoA kinase n=1 Tax=Undibacterium aquatile TaxID=1537398 RepID=A0ABR6XG13_9BURK|nr:dephospho-CoA kinase [Undibacterium aquatile]MBC3811555.1 dephospho-CoA kinase [Undibacterium aquatile]